MLVFYFLQMKKSLIFLTCFFLLITTQTLNSKEIRSMFGFYVDIPDEYEDYGYEIQNSKRQHKHKTQKFKQREEYYDD